MSAGREKLAEQLERLPLDTALKSAVLEGVENTDDESAAREAEALRDLLDKLPGDLQAVRDAVARDRRRRAEETSMQDVHIFLPMDEPMAMVEIGRGEASYFPILEPNVCPHCGQEIGRTGGLEQFLGRLGVTEDMIDNLKGQFQNIDIDEYLNTARDYLKDHSGKATTYAKENPGKVASGVAAIALGAGLIYAALNRDPE